MRVLVNNIPIHAYETGIVEVPDGTPPEKLQDAVRESLLRDGYKAISGLTISVDLDTGIIEGGWEFDVAEWRF